MEQPAPAIHFQSFLLLIILLFTAGCTKQDGGVAGKLTPPGHGMRVTALQNGNAVASVEADPDSGGFSIAVAPGIYDVSISVPGSAFPMLFQGLQVQPGKITDLSVIELAVSPSGTAVLSGRIVPAGAGTTITLSSEGRERAAISADPEGKYLFTQLPAGSYTLQAKAPDYAPERATINVSGNGTAVRNLRLLYASAIDGVDWAAGTIRATGIGAVPPNAPNATIGREMAQRAAVADAQRKLLNAVAQIKLGPDEYLKSQMGERNFSRKIQGFISGYRIVAQREQDGGRIEVDLELPVTGPNGISRYLDE